MAIAAMSFLDLLHVKQLAVAKQFCAFNFFLCTQFSRIVGPIARISSSSSEPSRSLCPTAMIGRPYLEELGTWPMASNIVQSHDNPRE